MKVDLLSKIEDCSAEIGIIGLGYVGLPRPPQLISLEFTTYPGTTEELILPLLEKKGLKAGKDFFLVFSPEREDPGNYRWSLSKMP